MNNYVARIIFCGGRFSSRHAEINILCAESKLKTFVLTDLSKFGCTSSFERFKDGNVEIVDTGSEATTIPQKIHAARKKLKGYNMVLITGVDDLVTDEAIAPLPLIKFLEKGSIAVSFGIDISYRSCQQKFQSTLFGMPRFSIRKEVQISQEEYWMSLAKIVALGSSTDRVLSFFTEVSMFPFVYSVYNTKGLLNFCRAFLATLKQCSICSSSSFASILFEFLIVTTSLAVSDIFFTEKIFRLNNYSSTSAGSDPYNYRTSISMPSEIGRVNRFIDVFIAIYTSMSLHHEGLSSVLLRSAYLLAAAQSIVMLQLTQRCYNLLTPKSSYQQQSLNYFNLALVNGLQDDKLNRMLRMWHE